MEHHLLIIKNLVQKDMEGVCQAHDRYHIERVWKRAQKIYTYYPHANHHVIECGALLHEWFDDKFFAPDKLAQRESILRETLTNIGLDKQIVNQILFIAKNVGFGKSKERDPGIQLPIEFQIVEDADRLEALGAIVIARTFAYGGANGRAIYDPHEQPRNNITREQYKLSNGTSINHFYEKLLLLKDLMHTPEAKQRAEKKHAFMEIYLEQFFKERNCEL